MIEHLSCQLDSDVGKVTNKGTTALLLLTAITSEFLYQYNPPSQKVKALGLKKNPASVPFLTFTRNNQALAQGESLQRT
jgi:hypothetical protein